MKKIIISATISVVALVGCTSQVTPAPAPTVTITEQAPAPDSIPEDTTQTLTNSERFVQFVRENGGLYGQVAEESNLLSMGNTICDGFASGLSEDEITSILASALIKNDMANDDGAKLGAALIVGAQTYLCSVTY